MMRSFPRIAWLAFVTTLMACSQSQADLMLFTIRDPEHCPEGLSIKSKANKGMIDFEIEVDPEAISHNESYRGRTHANAILRVANAEGPVASVSVQPVKESNLTRYHVRLSPAAAKHSELQVGVSLYEKNGRPTFGGGVSLQIHLGGFLPKVNDEK